MVQLLSLNKRKGERWKNESIKEHNMKELKPPGLCTSNRHLEKEMSQKRWLWNDAECRWLLYTCRICCMYHQPQCSSEHYMQGQAYICVKPQLKQTKHICHLLFQPRFCKVSGVTSTASEYSCMTWTWLTKEPGPDWPKNKVEVSTDIYIFAEWKETNKNSNLAAQ